jgi:glycosyltransferase involved in cell wall biosynthesis
MYPERFNHRQVMGMTSRSSTDSPLVSVCVPTYNDAVFLSQSLQSIVNQTYRNLEIIVGDDASNDNTTEIVHRFQDSRIHYHRNSRNLGQFENVNSLVQKATGKYIAIYHSDDVYDPNIVEKEVNFLEAHPEAGAVFTMNWQIDQSGQIIGQSKLLREVSAKVCLSLTDVLPVLLRYKNRLLIGPSFMGRANVFEKVGLFSSAFSIAGDFEMWLRILTAFKIGILDEPLMSYRRGKTQVSYDYQRLRTFEDHFFAIIDRYLETEDLRSCLDPVSITEYTFHRCDDATFRAANFVIQGHTDKARQLLQNPYPWGTLTVPRLQRRKLRVLLLRILLYIALTIGAVRLLSNFLVQFEYGGKL